MALIAAGAALVTSSGLLSAMAPGAPRSPAQWQLPPTPLSLTPTTPAPSGALVYHDRVFQQREVDASGNVSPISRQLNAEPPIPVPSPNDYFAYFERISPSPHGAFAVAVAAVETGDLVDIVDTVTGNATRLTWSTADGRVTSAAGVFYGWHPNGYEFLFREDNAPDRGLWLVDARTGAHRVLAQPPTQDISGAAISPDGQRLVYATNTFDVHQIWMAHANGRVPHLLLQSDTIVYVFSWSPDGRYLLYAGEPSANRTAAGGPLWVMDHEGQNREPLMLPFLFGFGFEPVWSPGGHQVAATGATEDVSACWHSSDAFLADPLCRYRGTGVYVETIGAGQAQLAMPNAIDPAWSPDGSWLAVSRMDEREQIDIWLVNPHTAEVHRGTDTPGFDRHPVWLNEEQSQ